jgi:hypothetical protein
MPLLELIRNDKGYDIEFTVLDADEDPVNLTSSTISFKVRKWNDSYAKFVGTCVITDALAGKCKYTVTATDFDAVGKYKAEIEVVWLDGKVMTASDLTITIQEDITIRPTP